ncbi:uncharacterized protein Ibf1 isoform X3 [Drosophila pseudoobscura]|uniref:Uncharacterized protein Ibf1 isoform X3 n=1 Tax=Drosophila pseudoobscura pseudoobscura TaxID=46245 RepID=A0A6I8VNL6_DROPS|nr:uncharacterized protein LOC4800357 isoform X3 [Drosophila pseudoobscura]
MPRKKSEDFYKKFGFSAKCENGKYTATCTFCNKELQNTALTRLSLHRQTCDQKRALSETQSINMERARPVLKIHKITHEDADGGIDHGNEGKEIIVKTTNYRYKNFWTSAMTIQMARSRRPRSNLNL